MEFISPSIFGKHGRFCHIKQIVIRSDKKDIQNFSCVNRRVYNLCKDKFFIEAVYHQKSEQFTQEVLNLKDSDTTWKNFYRRVIKFYKNQYSIGYYASMGSLLEIKLYATMNPPRLPEPINAHYAALRGEFEVLKYFDSIGIKPVDSDETAHYVACSFEIEKLKHLISLGFKIKQKTKNFIKCAAMFMGTKNMIEMSEYLETIEII